MIDTARLKLSLPLDKVTRLQSLLRQWRGKKCCTRKELESLAGHVLHAATVVWPGCIFLCNLFSLLSKVSKLTHFTRLNLETRADLAWWQCLLQHWIGSHFSPCHSNYPDLLWCIRVFRLRCILPWALFMVLLGHYRNNLQRNSCLSLLHHCCLVGIGPEGMCVFTSITRQLLA